MNCLIVAKTNWRRYGMLSIAKKKNNGDVVNCLTLPRTVGNVIIICCVSKARSKCYQDRCDKSYYKVYEFGVSQIY